MEIWWDPRRQWPTLLLHFLRVYIHAINLQRKRAQVNQGDNKKLDQQAEVARNTDDGCKGCTCTFYRAAVCFELLYV